LKKEKKKKKSYYVFRKMSIQYSNVVVHPGVNKQLANLLLNNYDSYTVQVSEGSLPTANSLLNDICDCLDATGQYQVAGAVRLTQSGSDAFDLSGNLHSIVGAIVNASNVNGNITSEKFTVGSEESGELSVSNLAMADYLQYIDLDVVNQVQFVVAAPNATRDFTFDTVASSAGIDFYADEQSSNTAFANVDFNLLYTQTYASTVAQFDNSIPIQIVSSGPVQDVVYDNSLDTSNSSFLASGNVSGTREMSNLDLIHNGTLDSLGNATPFLNVEITKSLATSLQSQVGSFGIANVAVRSSNVSVGANVYGSGIDVSVQSYREYDRDLSYNFRVQYLEESIDPVATDSANIGKLDVTSAAQNANITSAYNLSATSNITYTLPSANIDETTGAHHVFVNSRSSTELANLGSSASPLQVTTTWRDLANVFDGVTVSTAVTTSGLIRDLMNTSGNLSLTVTNENKEGEAIWKDATTDVEIASQLLGAGTFASSNISSLSLDVSAILNVFNVDETSNIAAEVATWLDSANFSNVNVSDVASVMEFTHFNYIDYNIDLSGSYTTTSLPNISFYASTINNYYVKSADRTALTGETELNAAVVSSSWDAVNNQVVYDVTLFQTGSGRLVAQFTAKVNATADLSNNLTFTNADHKLSWNKDVLYAYAVLSNATTGSSKRYSDTKYLVQTQTSTIAAVTLEDLATVGGYTLDGQLTGLPAIYTVSGSYNKDLFTQLQEDVLTQKKLVEREVAFYLKGDANRDVIFNRKKFLFDNPSLRTTAPVNSVTNDALYGTTTIVIDGVNRTVSNLLVNDYAALINVITNYTYIVSLATYALGIVDEQNEVVDTQMNVYDAYLASYQMPTGVVDAVATFTFPTLTVTKNGSAESTANYGLKSYTLNRYQGSDPYSRANTTGVFLVRDVANVSLMANPYMGDLQDSAFTTETTIAADYMKDYTVTKYTLDAAHSLTTVAGPTHYTGLNADVYQDVIDDFTLSTVDVTLDSATLTAFADATSFMKGTVRFLVANPIVEVSDSQGNTVTTYQVMNYSEAKSGSGADGFSFNWVLADNSYFSASSLSSTSVALGGSFSALSTSTGAQTGVTESYTIPFASNKRELHGAIANRYSVENSNYKVNRERWSVLRLVEIHGDNRIFSIDANGVPSIKSTNTPLSVGGKSSGPLTLGRHVYRGTTQHGYDVTTDSKAVETDNLYYIDHSVKVGGMLQLIMTSLSEKPSNTAGNDTLINVVTGVVTVGTTARAQLQNLQPEASTGFILSDVQQNNSIRAQLLIPTVDTTGALANGVHSDLLYFNVVTGQCSVSEVQNSNNTWSTTITFQDGVTSAPAYLATGQLPAVQFVEPNTSDNNVTTENFQWFSLTITSDVKLGSYLSDNQAVGFYHISKFDLTKRESYQVY
jgi:hypothetical protein